MPLQDQAVRFSSGPPCLRCNTSLHGWCLRLNKESNGHFNPVKGHLLETALMRPIPSSNEVLPACRYWGGACGRSWRM